MSVTKVIFNSLFAIVLCFAGAAIYVVDLDRHTSAAIADSARYDLAWACVQAKVEVTNLGQAIGRHAIAPSRASLRDLRVQSEIIGGRADSFRSGEYRKLTAVNPAVAVLVTRYTDLASALETLLPTWMQTGNLPAADAHIGAMQKALEPLCSTLQQQTAEGIEVSQSKLRSAHGAALALMVGLIAGGLVLICMLILQNRVVVQAFARQREISEQHEYTANHDILTGLPNRGLFFRELDHLLDCLMPGRSVAVITMDLDRFKIVNDTLGHQAGDKLLVSVAQRLAEFKASGAFTMIARLGGDEFIAFVACPDAATTAISAAESIIERISTPHRLDDHAVVVSATVGIAVSGSGGANSLELARRSDVALSHAKSRERGTWCQFDEQMDDRVRNRRALELDMRTAIERGEFELHYQPFVHLKSGQIQGVEALLRWNHPTHGMISPSTFVPIAEESGLIVAIGRYALERACRDALRMPSSWTVAVNLSAVQFIRDDLTIAVRDALAVTRFDPSRLELEITESVMLGDERNVHAVLDGLQSLGVKIALDDFGTGYSSLSYLRQFGFSKMKIDQSFVRAATDDPEGLALLRAIVGLGHTLSLEITAEGIETTEQCAALRSVDCTYGQGYLFAKPLPLDTLLKNAGAACGAKRVLAA